MYGFPISPSIIFSNICNHTINQVKQQGSQLLGYADSSVRQLGSQLLDVNPDLVLAASTVVLAGAIAYNTFKQSQLVQKPQLSINTDPKGLVITLNREFIEALNQLLKVIAQNQSRFPHYPRIQRPVFLLQH